MNKRAALLVALVCTLPAVMTAQQGKPAPARPAAPAPAASRPTAALTTPEEIVREWFRRWNALDGTEAPLRRLIDLYEPTGANQVPPSDTQIGPVFMEGADGVRKMANDFMKSWMMPADRIDKVTADGKSTELFLKSQGPWGGPAVGVQYTQVAVDRATKKRYSLPAFAVFHIEGGKIRYARFYATRVETREE
jgi:hypothetical protein